MTILYVIGVSTFVGAILYSIYATLKSFKAI